MCKIVMKWRRDGNGVLGETPRRTTLKIVEKDSGKDTTLSGKFANLINDRNDVFVTDRMLTRLLNHWNFISGNLTENLKMFWENWRRNCVYTLQINNLTKNIYIEKGINNSSFCYASGRKFSHKFGKLLKFSLQEREFRNLIKMGVIPIVLWIHSVVFSVLFADLWCNCLSFSSLTNFLFLTSQFLCIFVFICFDWSMCFIIPRQLMSTNAISLI